MSINISSPLFRARMRKEFNRVTNLGSHDPLAVPGYGIGRFAGISTQGYTKRPEITVRYYNTETVSEEPKELPEYIHVGSHRCAIRFQQYVPEKEN